MNEDVQSTLDALRAAGAARFDAVGWHYVETLAERTRAQSGPVQSLLNAKLAKVLTELASRMQSFSDATGQGIPLSAPCSGPSPLITLLRDMHRIGYSTSNPKAETTPSAWRTENPRVKAFRQQLSKISIQKQVNHALAQAPQNAGPINSHMLVLRALGLMRDISPDYLNRFMTHVEALMSLDESGKPKPLPQPKRGTAKTPSS